MNSNLRLITLIAAALELLSMPTTSVAVVNWTSGAGNYYWNIAQNWSSGTLPASVDSVHVNTKINLPGQTGKLDPVIVNRSTAYAGTLIIGSDGMSIGQVTVNGTLSCNSSNNSVLGLGWYGPSGSSPGNAGIATINSTGKVQANWLIVGREGAGKLIMNGGTVSTSVLSIADSKTSTGTVELNGGIIEVTYMFGMEGVFFGGGGGSSHLGISKGKLIISGDVRSTIQHYINVGKITAYNGNPRAVVMYDYDIISKKTTVWADASEFSKLPQPKNKGTVNKLLPQLTWLSGYSAQKHDFYFGNNFNDVNNSSRTQHIGATIYRGDQVQPSYSMTEPLILGNTYYWRVDEVNDSDLNSPYKGKVWSFKVTPHKPTIYVLDIQSPIDRKMLVDIQHAAVCIQGIENRTAPRVMLRNGFSWEAQLTEPNGLCEDWNIKTVRDIYDLITLFKADIKGVVAYDNDSNTGVNSTLLVATTIAGVENAIAVRKDTSAGSMYNYLVNDANGPRFPVLMDLTGKFSGTGIIWQTSITSTGSARCDAYIWAIEKYIKTGKCDPNYVMTAMDLRQLDPNLAMQIMNLDYAIQKRAFCFELSPWGDEIPSDDAGQPMGTDLNTFKAILNACNQRTSYQSMISVSGFPVKKAGTKHTDPDWAWEWEYFKLISAYNGYGVVEFCISNTSLYASLQPAVALRRYTQNPAPTYNDFVNRGYINASGSVVAGNYVMIGLGDYDCATWVLQNLANSTGIYSDSLRGQVYCNWAVNPNLVEKASVGIDYMYRHKTSKDTFVAWDSGGGYINPTQLHGSRNPSGYPSGVNIWQKHCRKYYRILDYSISAWLLNGDAGTLSDTDCANFKPFSGDGIGVDSTFPTSQELYNNVPIMKLSPDGNPVASQIINNYSGVHFKSYRTILWTPEQVKSLQDACPGRHFLDAYSFNYLLRYYLGGNNYYRASWIGDTIPRIMTAGQAYRVNIMVRNDGWDTWTTSSGYNLGYGFVPFGADQNNALRAHSPATMTVDPGQTVTFQVDLVAPATVGSYDLFYDMLRENVTWFSSQNNIEWKITITVVADANKIDTDDDGCPDLLETANNLSAWNPDDHVTFDMNGLIKFMDSWLEQQSPGGADFNCDHIVNMCDWAIFARHAL